MEKIGVIGSGDVGKTLARGFQKHGYDVRIASRTPEKLRDFSAESGIPAVTFAEAAAWGDVIVLAVHGAAAQEAARTAGPQNLNGKVVIDTTNPIKEAPPIDGVLQYFTGPNSSLLEELQRALPQARLVKAFSSVGNTRMVNPKMSATADDVHLRQRRGREEMGRRPLGQVRLGDRGHGCRGRRARHRAAGGTVVHSRLPAQSLDARVQGPLGLTRRAGEVRTRAASPADRSARRAPPATKRCR